MLGLLGILITAAAAVFGYNAARSFVRRRLAYVDAVQQGYAPFVAGAAAWLLAMPVVWLLPLVGGGTALLFGAAVCVGVAAGAQDIRKRLRPG